MSCTTPAGSPKRLLNPNFSPRTPVKKGSTPSSSKYCLVCGIILRNENFYALSRPELLCALNAILQTTVQFPLVKEDQRRVCKSCFRRLELIKDKKSVLEALEKEFQGKYNSTVLKNRETTANGQTKIALDVCHEIFRSSGGTRHGSRMAWGASSLNRSI